MKPRAVGSLSSGVTPLFSRPTCYPHNLRRAQGAGLPALTLLFAVGKSRLSAGPTLGSKLTVVAPCSSFATSTVKRPLQRRSTASIAASGETENNKKPDVYIPLANLKYRTPRQERRLQAALREQWHLRQKRSAATNPVSVKASSPTITIAEASAIAAADVHNTGQPLSKNQLLRNVPLDKQLLAFIDKHRLGKRRDPARRIQRSSTAPPPEFLRVKPPSDSFFERKLNFVGAAKTKDSFLPETLPEVAVVGRSNVGKSSFINALTGQARARTSDKPGLTRSINWYNLQDKLYLVDLPGYGFAFAQEQEMEQWRKMMRAYLTTRNTLKRVCLLVDARHGLKASDIEFIQLLQEAGQRFQVVLTKVDVLEPLELARRAYLVKMGLARYKRALPTILMVSSKHNQGISATRKELYVFALGSNSDGKDDNTKQQHPTKATGGKAHKTSAAKTAKKKEESNKVT
ncbi:EngB-type G domain-containing protein [Balamuthia mandrillaris]